MPEYVLITHFSHFATLRDYTERALFVPKLQYFGNICLTVEMFAVLLDLFIVEPQIKHDKGHLARG